ncbi:MAG: MotA/TolQ/ExbB proton channel family protein [Gammaproteobacteria bacterium]|nr:MotA/TolQ/ExbB proton channel family protein [Gammaproteobacteria bacterium]
MVNILSSGGWLILPLLFASILAMAIVAERYWALRRSVVVPPNLVEQILQWHHDEQLTQETIVEIHRSSPLGRMLAAGLLNRNHPREVMKESLEESGRHQVHEMERYLSTLGTIAAGAPLVGLLGTVMGIIKVFDAITLEGVGDPTILSGGISEALITTAVGLSVAIPSLIFYRLLKRRVDELVVEMEQAAIRVVEIIHGNWEVEPYLPQAPLSQQITEAPPPP